MIQLKKTLRLASVLAALFVTALGAWADGFTQADLEKMVKELETVLPPDPKLVYPIKCTVVEKKDVNAYATATKEDGKLRATMVVFSGLVDFAKNDLKMIRAVVAHEVSHLSRGHVTGPAPAAADASNLWTRQQEFDADITGASALQRLGYSKDDMVAMLLMLETLNDRKGSWWERISADHADPKARAAEIADNPAVLKALMQFDVGLAFMDSRRWAMAKRFFDEAYARQPKLVEALVNAGQCELMRYYDFLPFDVREAWLRPDFGPVLAKPGLGVRGDVVTDSDRKRYADTLAKLEEAVAKSESARAKELLALAQVLEPDAKKEVVQKGIDAMKAMIAARSDSKEDQIERLRLANNLCVGYHRLADLDAGYAALMDAQRKTTYFNYALGENLGRITVNKRSDSDEQLAMNVMFTWLKNAQKVAPYWESVHKNYVSACERLSLKPETVEARPLFFCKAVAMVVGGREYGLFRPVEEFRDGLGDPDATIRFSDVYTDLMEMRWKGGNVSIFTERGSAMRLTTYDSGSRLFLQPTDRAVAGGFNITVGMSEADLKKFLDPASGVAVELAKGGDLEEWLYWPSLNMGILIQDGKVGGLTITPVAD